MENKYYYGGFIQCRGKMDDGTKWENYNVLLARVSVDEDGSVSEPRAAFIGKAKVSPDTVRIFTTLKIGALVNVYFDERGKISAIFPADSSK